MNTAVLASTAPLGTSGLADIAETMASTFVDAVKAAEANNIAQIGKQVDLVESAMLQFEMQRQRIDEKRQEAARLIAESVQLEEEAISFLRAELEIARQGLEAITSQKQEGRKRLRAINGGKRST